MSSSSTSTTAPATTTTVTSKASAAAAYLTAVAPLNAAAGPFNHESAAWTSSTTAATAAKDAAPVIAAFKSASAALTNDRWPANTVADVHTLIGDIGAVTGDLEGLATVNMLDASSWVSTYDRDVATMGTAVGLVRHDLGLPPSTP
jgi:hypothetical protein